MQLKQWNFAVICVLMSVLTGCGANADETVSVNTASDNIPVISWNAVDPVQEPTAEELLAQELAAGSNYALSLSQNGIPVTSGTALMSETHIRLVYEGETEETFAYSDLTPHKMVLDSLQELPNCAVASYEIKDDAICIDIIGFTQEAGYGVFFSESQKNAWKMRCYPDGSCEVEDDEGQIDFYDYYWGFDGHLFLRERPQAGDGNDLGHAEDTDTSAQTDEGEEDWKEYSADASSEGWLRLSHTE